MWFEIMSPNKHLHPTVTAQIPRFKKHLSYFIERAGSSDLKISIIYYPTPLKKTKPSKCEKFAEVHVQSGFTKHFYDGRTIIVIYRFEEAVKVFVHELIHAFKYHCIMSSSFIQIGSFGCFDKTLEKKQKFDEALVETWATLLTSDDIAKQTRFSIFQTAKILMHYNFFSFDEFWNPSSRSPRMIPNHPALFPYYILKSAFLFQSDKFKKKFPLHDMRGCHKYTAGDIRSFIEHHAWIEQVDLCIKAYNDFKPWHQTMRMTCE